MTAEELSECHKKSFERQDNVKQFSRSIWKHLTSSFVSFTEERFSEYQLKIAWYKISCCHKVIVTWYGHGQRPWILDERFSQSKQSLWRPQAFWNKTLVYVQPFITPLCPLRVHKHGFIVHNRFIKINCWSTVHYDISLQLTSLQRYNIVVIYHFALRDIVATKSR